MDKVQRIEAKILELCKDDEVREKIDALVCISGISYVSAISIVAEIGDFSRFSKAKSFVSFIGLCPGEDSSGNRVRHTAITKAGNSRVKRQSAVRPSSLSKGKSGIIIPVTPAAAAHLQKFCMLSGSRGKEARMVEAGA